MSRLNKSNFFLNLFVKVFIYAMIKVEEKEVEVEKVGRASAAQVVPSG